DIHGFDMVYGLSMGGAIANIIYANELLKMNILIIDGGVYPDNLPYILNRLHVFQNTLEVKIVRRSKRIMKMVYPPDRWLYPWEDEDSYKESMDFLNRLTNDTIKNCFDSCSNYKLPATFPKNDTKIYLFYGELEKKDMAWSIKSFRKTYPQAIYREFPDTDHGELSTIKYKECIQIIDEIAKK
ncbi:MAG: hypothetical protein Q4Q07_09780, partial [Tissierellia bacterium]|nr:hypothetical protein [Tissierellia bacterium]